MKPLNFSCGEVRNISDGGYERGFEAGKQEGYEEGYAVGSEQNAEAAELWKAATNNGYRGKYLFYRCGYITELPEISLPNVKDMESAFESCSKLKKLVVNIPSATTISKLCIFCSAMEDVTVTISKQCTNAYRAFWTEWGKMTHVTINGDTSGITNWGETFGKGDIETLTGDIEFYGTVNYMTFYACWKLKNIAPKTIAKDFNISYSPLTIESAKAIITALVDYSGTDEEYSYTLTLSTATLELLESEGATAPNGKTWVEYADSKGWNL
jgi:hypothetical protein